MKRDIAKTVDEKSAPIGKRFGEGDARTSASAYCPNSRFIARHNGIRSLRYLRIKIWKTGGIDARFSGFARERVSLAVTKLRSNRRQTGPLTNLRATINNVKANSRIERRSRTPSVATRRGARVFPFVSTTKRRVLACDCDLEREREGGFLRARLRTYLPRTRFTATEEGNCGNLFTWEAISSSKSRTRTRPSPGSRVSRTRATRRLFSTLPLFPFNLLVSFNILQIVLYLTTILTTINRQQKSILPQRTCKKCATQPASTSGDPSDAFASSSFDFKKPISCFSPRKERRPARFSATFSSAAGSRACRLTYHMFQNSTNHDRIAFSRTHSQIAQQNAL